MSVIEIQNLTKQFGTVSALDDLPFRVEEGEIFGFLGRMNPINAYVKVLVEAFDESPESLARQVLLTSPQPGVNTVATSTGYAVAALLAWGIVGPIVGYLVFDGKDVL